MELNLLIKNIISSSTIRDGIFAFTNVKDNKDFPYPSIILFKGNSSRYGKGYSLLVDAENILKSWESEIETIDDFSQISDLIFDLTDTVLRPVEINLEYTYEDFIDFISMFMMNKDIDIIIEKFETKEFYDKLLIKKIENYFRRLNVIKESTDKFIHKEDKVYKLEVTETGSTILFSVDLKKYVDMVNELKNESDIRLLWVILRLILEKSIFQNMLDYNPMIVSNGMVKISIVEHELEELKVLLEKITGLLLVSKEKIFEMFYKTKKYAFKLQRIVKLHRFMGFEQDNKLLEVLDVFILDYILNKEDALLLYLKEFSDSIDDFCK